MSRQPLLEDLEAQNYGSSNAHTSKYNGESHTVQSQNLIFNRFNTQALKKLIVSGRESIRTAPETRFNCRQSLYIGAVTILALISGYLFFKDSQKGAERHFGGISILILSTFLIWFARISGMVTNAGFNWLSIHTAKEEVIKKPSEASATLTGGENTHTKRIAASIIGGAALAPFLAQGLKDSHSGFEKVAIAVSAGINFIVNTDGAVSLFNFVPTREIKDQVREFICSEDSKSDRAIRKVRKLIVSHLSELADEISKYSDLDFHKLLERFFGNDFSTPQEERDWKNILNQIFKTSRDESVAKKTSCGIYIFRVVFFFLAISAFFANFGPSMMTYSGSRELFDPRMSQGPSSFLAVLIAFCHTASGIGFTIKGLFGLWATIPKLINGDKTFVRREAPKAYWALSFFFLAFALFSGFPVGEMNYEASKKYLGFGGELIAKILDLLGNVGTAALYNLPQVWSLVEFIITYYLERRSPVGGSYEVCQQKNRTKMQIALCDWLKQLADDFKNTRIKNLKDLLNDPDMPEALTEFVKEAVRRGQLTEAEARALGPKFKGFCLDENITDNHQSDSEGVAFAP